MGVSASGSPSSTRRHGHQVNASSPINPVRSQMIADRLANHNIIHDRYMLEKTIGKGSYGKVKLAIDLSDPHRHVRRALKFISLESIKKPAHVSRLRRETTLLKCLHHPHLVKLIDHFQTSEDLVLVMEYVQGQDLFDRITKHPQQRLTEGEARPIFRQLVSALDYCHQHNVVHRDIKPENVMLTDEGVVKLIDFGFANVFDAKAGRLETNCGSPLYASPEIVRGIPYVGPETDCWSLGVVLFAMLTGTLPFEDDALKVLYEKICRGQFACPKYLSASAVDLLRKLICVDGRHRGTMEEIRTHPWTVEGYAVRPESYVPIRASLSSLDLNVVAAIGKDLGMDVDQLRLDIMIRPDSPAHSIYILYIEQAEREKNVNLRCKSPTGPLYTMTDLDIALGGTDPWVKVNQITFNNDAGGDRNSINGLLKFDFDALMRRVRLYQQEQQQQPGINRSHLHHPKQQSIQSISESASNTSDINHPQPYPHSNFLQQAVGHLNSQFKRIKNMINSANVHLSQ